jgi:uncharacterized protein YdhG (YjbR/CyaY superfamily)
MTVDDYFTRVPEPARSMLAKLRAATETISYRMPAFKVDGGVIMWYAAFRDHCSLFPGGSVLATFKRELTGFKTSKGTVQFALDKPLPIALISRIVKARLVEHQAKGDAFEGMA